LRCSAPPAVTAPLLVVMGVAGAGKTTVGRLLATRLGLPFLEGDDYHPPANIAKMSSGRALTDEDRLPWLRAIACDLAALAERGEGAVVACSALKQAYRDELARGLPAMIFVHLTGPPELVAARLARRAGHFMPPALLESQYLALEPPADGLTVDISAPPDAIVDAILERLTLLAKPATR